ncbi:Zn-dependent hydrolase [Rhizobium leguminosarum]|uniref:Zn-dependent hydrolase n=2 Tax=Rhizobium leguminosarum TaxID=384 RepID=A0A154I7B0_RHILE|nr:Zn-dependent hydrolase [Rhizobium leguminosarum]KZA96426.1 Zn-dependent hydrolase [Rhizobium leguminosarum]
MSDISVDGDRLLGRLKELGNIGRDAGGRLVRLAGSDGDKLGRDLFVCWLSQAGLDVAVDRIGNIFGIWRPAGTEDCRPLMLGSHIDTVINAGIYDGCYGVVAGLEVIQALKAANFRPIRPIAVAAFTNEEGVRFAPDMMGSLVYARGLDVDAALSTVGTDGAILGEELKRIGYAGAEAPGFLKPFAYVELHIEQGPVLEREGIALGAVENLQGISWQRITVEGTANHAGTTPINMRSDAGYGAARIIAYLRERARSSATPTVATVGCLDLEPNAINVIPSRATLTVDLRDPFEHRLREESKALGAFLEMLAREEQLLISAEELAQSSPVAFNQEIVQMIEGAAEKRGLTCRRMTSGAGHDAQMIAPIAPTAMIFVPSCGGISHNPAEYTSKADLIAGANVLMDVVRHISSQACI